MADNHADVAIIGGGYAGLIAGALLAKGGLKPVVFETTGNPGGILWKKTPFGDGFVADNVLHQPLIQLTYNNGAGFWLTAARELDIPIRFTMMPNSFLYVLPLDKRIIVPSCSNGTAYVDFCSEMSPEALSEDDKREFARIIDECFAVPIDEAYSLESETTLFRDWLAARTDNETIKMMLAAAGAPMTGLPLDQVMDVASLGAYLGTVIRGQLSGEFNLTCPLGDTVSCIPEGFCKSMVDNGGRFLPKHRVKQIIFDGNRAKGVEVQTPSGEMRTWKAKYVIMATAWYAVESVLPAENMTRGMVDSLRAWDSIRDVCIDVRYGLSKEVIDMKMASSYSLIDEDSRCAGWIACPTNLEPSMAPPGKQQLCYQRAILEDTFTSRRLQEWVDDGTAFCERVFPGFSNYIEATNVHLLRPLGSSLAHMAAARFPQEHPDIQNLYFAGECVQGRSCISERAADTAMSVAGRILRREK